MLAALPFLTAPAFSILMLAAGGRILAYVNFVILFQKPWYFFQWQFLLKINFGTCCSDNKIFSPYTFNGFTGPLKKKNHELSLTFNQC